MMKRFFTITTITALAAGACLFAACGEDNGNNEETLAVTGVELDKTTVDLSPIETLVLTPTVQPATALNQYVTWTSSSTAVATVKGGTVTPVSYGTTTISVITEEGGYTAACTVTVDLLGTVSFKSAKTWKVGAQVWSDAVMATGAKKNSFYGGDAGNYKADCRQNPGYGDLFTWVAVDTYKDKLCPDGWNVPVSDDFTDLHTALGDDPAAYYDENSWGGELGGTANYNGVLKDVGELGGYLGANTSDDYAFGLHYRTGGVIYYAWLVRKYEGYAVRCVRKAGFGD